MKPETSKLLTVDEVAQRLNISRAGAYRLVEKREIPALRIGRALRVPADELEQWLFAPEDDAA